VKRNLGPERALRVYTSRHQERYLLLHTTPAAEADVCYPDMSYNPQSSGGPTHTGRTWHEAGSPQTGPGSTLGARRCSHWPLQRRTEPALGVPQTIPENEHTGLQMAAKQKTTAFFFFLFFSLFHH
jgi:hypothetical protein